MELSHLGVTPRKERQFRKRGIESVEDLIEFLPRRYLDCSVETGILPEDKISCLVVKIKNISINYGRTTNVVGYGTIIATGEEISIWWFQQAYLYDKLHTFIGLNAFVAGKVRYNEKYQSYSISSPVVFEPACKGKGIYPVYPKIPGMGEEYLRERISNAFDIGTIFKETIPQEIIQTNHLPIRREALYRLHFPKTMAQVEQGRDRLIFDDLLYFALQKEKADRESAVGSPFQIKSYRLVRQIRDHLPYTLTSDQLAAIGGLFNAVKQGKRLNALVQGDVGCGKTIVAFLLMAGFVESGYQALIMAPTQVLAHQHMEDLKALVEPYGYKVAYLSSEQKQAEQKKIKDEIAMGKVRFIVGTSSLLGKDVEYHNLALIVTDEEHRFGVLQRTSLVEKAAAGVHAVMMSATPIPRSLAQVLYGNRVQLQTIRSMPVGRKPVITGLQSDRMHILRFVRTQVQKYHHQVYVVCPMIDANENIEGVRSVEEVSAEYHQMLEPYGVRIATLTGRDKKGQVDTTIQGFRRGDIDVLISTTVIEVGVNVPNATAIIITNAERFGLSSLHQLRGRVGRSNLQSFCVLESSGATPEGQMRLEAMCQTTDGFQIAEADLKIRGAGDLLGTKQSGENRYISLILAYPERYKRAQSIASEMLDDGISCALLERKE